MKKEKVKVELTPEQQEKKSRESAFRKKVKKQIADEGIRKGELIIEGINSIPKESDLRTGVERADMIRIIRSEIAARKEDLEFRKSSIASSRG